MPLPVSRGVVVSLPHEESPSTHPGQAGAGQSESMLRTCQALSHVGQPPSTCLSTQDKIIRQTPRAQGASRNSYPGTQFPKRLHLRLRSVLQADSCLYQRFLRRRSENPPTAALLRMASKPRKTRQKLMRTTTPDHSCIPNHTVSPSNQRPSVRKT